MKNKTNKENFENEFIGGRSYEIVNPIYEQWLQSNSVDFRIVENERQELMKLLTEKQQKEFKLFEALFDNVMHEEKILLIKFVVKFILQRINETLLGE